MGFLLLILAVLIGLLVHDDTGVEIGVDSRFDFLDPHWPIYGAH